MESFLCHTCQRCDKHADHAYDSFSKQQEQQAARTQILCLQSATALVALLLLPDLL